MASEIKLKVVEALQDDAYKGIARVDIDVMKKLDLKRGDIITIKGGRESVAIVDRAYPADIGEPIIRIDGIIRKNAKTGIGEQVSIKKADIKEAKKITIAPAQKGIMVQGDPEGVKQGLLGRAVTKGDIVVLGGSQRRRSLLSDTSDFDDIFGDILGQMHGFGFGGMQQIRFVVVSSTPNQPVVITDSTELTLNSKAVEISEVESKIPQITYEDIGGLSEEVRKIREMVELPLKHPEIFEKLGIEPPKGVLLHGPPGTGKTLLAKAVANESEANFISVSGPEIFDKFYGESEKNIKRVFEEAEKNAPSIIFFDEIDAIAPSREDNLHSGEVERRVVSQLLTMMDGLNSRGKVVVIAATNRPDSIDSALRRPGRFDREIEINVPNKEGRLQILKIHTRTMPIEGTIYQDAVAKNLIELIDTFLKESKIEKYKLDERIEELKRTRDRGGVIDNLLSKLTSVKTRINRLERVQKLVEARENLEKLSKELIEIYHTLNVRDRDDSRVKFIEHTKHKTGEGVSQLLDEIKELDLLEKEIWSKNSKYWSSVSEVGKVRDLEELSRITHGFVGADLSALAKESAMAVLRKLLPEIKLEDNKEIPKEVMEKLRVTKKDFEEALKFVRPSALREVAVETPNVSWGDVGGIEPVKRDLNEAVEWPLKFPDSFKRMGIRPPRGILLYGPPGTGKTLLAKAVAKESEANFIQIDGPELQKEGIVGKETERLRKMFKRARQVAPCIIFFDEIDSFARRRGSGGGVFSDSHESLLNTLLTEMDGLEEMKGIVVIAATNRPDMLDPALLRPGRFDRLVLVSPPEMEGRMSILQIHTKKMPLDKDISLSGLAKITEGYTGADIESLCREAAMLALREDRSSKTVRKKHFEEAMKKVPPSVSKQQADIYKRMEYEYLKSAKAALEPASGPNYLG